jgi:hypothetical protein
MLVTLLVVLLSLSLLLYQEDMLGGARPVPAGQAAAVSSQRGHSFVLHSEVSSQRFFSRLLLQQQLGLCDSSVIEPFLTQTRIFEGAVCELGATGLDRVRFATATPATVSVRTTPEALQSFTQICAELGGSMPAVEVRASDGRALSLEQFIATYGSDSKISASLHFAR